LQWCHDYTVKQEENNPLDTVLWDSPIWGGSSSSDYAGPDDVRLEFYDKDLRFLYIKEASEASVDTDGWKELRGTAPEGDDCSTLLEEEAQEGKKTLPRSSSGKAKKQPQVIESVSPSPEHNAQSGELYKKR